MSRETRWSSAMTTLCSNWNPWQAQSWDSSFYPFSSTKCVACSAVPRHRRSKSGQVETSKQCFPLTEHNRRKCKVQRIYPASHG